MKPHFFLILLLFISCQVNSQSRIEPLIPSAEEETEFVWQTIRDIEFFEKFNYQVNLPKHSFIDELISRSRKKELSDQDYEKLGEIMKSTIYKRDDYKSGFEKIVEQKETINLMISDLERENWSWKFKTFETYKVRLTLYGSGGNFNPETGIITLFTDTQGTFKMYKNPANTIIHEIVHIGIEESIIQKFQVSHAQKERIVDQFVMICFGEELPDYRVQNIGEPGIESQLTKKEDLGKLAELVEKRIQKD